MAGGGDIDCEHAQKECVMDGSFPTELVEVTPTQLRCGIGACPAVYRTPSGSYVIVGRTLSSIEAGAALPGRIGESETAVEINAAFLDDLFRQP